MPKINEEYAVLTASGSLVIERMLPGPIERVWAYLTESEKRSRWIAAGDMDLCEGGAFELIFDHDILSETKEDIPEKYKDEPAENMRMTGHVMAVDAPRLLTISWNEGASKSDVTFELEPIGDQVKLTLTHRGLVDKEMMIGVSAGWHTHVAIMIDNLEGVKVRPFWSTHMPLEDVYAKRLFGDT